MHNRDLRGVRHLAHLLDTRFQILGFRFGFDGILGLIPVVGDIVTTCASFVILAQAASLGCPPSTIFRMALNIAIEDIIDVIPFFGNIFDFIWKSNSKNVALLEAHLANPKKTTLVSRIIVGLIFVGLIAIMIGIAFATYTIFLLIWQKLRAEGVVDV